MGILKTKACRAKPYVLKNVVSMDILRMFAIRGFLCFNHASKIGTQFNPEELM